jgi:predicted Fe-Mo cluster-binding NifX family protein
MRVAVASFDGAFVDRHFGHAQQFLICELVDGDVRLFEVRNNAPACGKGRDDLDDPMLRTVELVSDCQVVLAAKVGPCAAELLLAQNIRWIETTAAIAQAAQRAVVAK